MRANRIRSVVFKTAKLAGLVALALLALGAVEARADSQGKAVQRVSSRDGTRIAYEKFGSGPALIIVNGALAARDGGTELAQLLAAHFTVYSYDRRGRGDSGDKPAYAVQREVEDIAALIDAAGGSAHLYGKSSGAALALHAAATLGDKVGKLAIYEAPYNEAEGAAREWRTFRARLTGLLVADRRAEAVTAFMKFVGAPETAIAQLKASPAWPQIEAMAPTLAYDTAILGDDRAVPTTVAAAVRARTLVMDGGASLEPMPFMRASADKIAQHIPKAKRRTIKGQAHDVSAEVLAPILHKFFR
jgi:pimeloyl-ACP methyl ester carboxylesterase